MIVFVCSSIFNNYQEYRIKIPLSFLQFFHYPYEPSFIWPTLFFIGIFMKSIQWKVREYLCHRLLPNGIQKILHLAKWERMLFTPSHKIPFLFMTTWKLILLHLLPLHLQKSWKENKIIENKNEATKARLLRKLFSCHLYKVNFHRKQYPEMLNNSIPLFFQK